MIKRDVDRDNPTRINYTREGFPVSSLARRRGAGRDGKKVEKRRRWRKRAIKMAKLFASKESRLARSGNGLAAGYGTLLPSYCYANVHLFPRVLEKDGHLSLSLSLSILRSIATIDKGTPIARFARDFLKRSKNSMKRDCFDVFKKV